MPVKTYPGTGRADQNSPAIQPIQHNSQPWHFIVASTEEGKARVANPLPVIMCSTNVKYLMPRTRGVLCKNRDGRCLAEAGC